MGHKQLYTRLVAELLIVSIVLMFVLQIYSSADSFSTTRFNVIDDYQRDDVAILTHVVNLNAHIFSFITVIAGIVFMMFFRYEFKHHLDHYERNFTAVFHLAIALVLFISAMIANIPSLWLIIIFLLLSGGFDYFNTKEHAKYGVKKKSSK